MRLFQLHSVKYYIIGNDDFYSIPIYAESEVELHAYIYKLLDFGKFSEITKIGTSLELHTRKIKFVTPTEYVNMDAYFYWMNRKYYIFDDTFKSFLLRCFESLEEYEICQLIIDNK